MNFQDKVVKNFDFVVFDIVFGFLFGLVACPVCKNTRHNAPEITPCTAVFFEPCFF